MGQSRHDNSRWLKLSSAYTLPDDERNLQMGKISGISCDLETHLKNSLLHFMMAKRDRLESGAVLAEGCAVGVSLQLC